VEKIDLSYMPENTRKVFNKLEDKNLVSDFVLVGGTALALQIQHRQSEDLDFIFDGKNLPLTKIKRVISQIFPDHKIIRQDEKWQIDFIVQQVKVTFFTTEAIALPFVVNDYSIKYNNMNIASIDIIATLKMAAIAQRNTIRDYYDLYWIAKYHIKLIDIIAQTKKLIPGLASITYSETLVYTKDISEQDLSNHLKPKENITKEEIATFFIDELRKIKKQIIK
jgi:predicted nucleotidyltransferase component of viral defense system